MIEKLKKANPLTLQVWMWSAGIMGFGLGALANDSIQGYALSVTLLALIIHLWAMYKIYVKR